MTRRHPDAKPPFKQPPRAPGRQPRCRWCWREVPKGCRSWCGEACVNEYQLEYDWSIARAFVLDRDRGVCAICRHDTEKLAQILDHSRRSAKRLDWYSGEVHQATIRLLGGQPHLYDLWQADHIVPRADGGSDHPRNLRTLCIQCHNAVTSAQAAERAGLRRLAKSIT